MDDLNPRRTRTPWVRALGWVGLWLSTFTVFPALLLWLQFFHLPRPVGLPPPGDPRFWDALGVCALMASLMICSIWRSRSRPGRRVTVQKPTTPGERRRRGIAGVALLAFLVVRVMAANPGASPDWLGVIGGAAGVAALVAAVLACAKLALSGDTEGTTVAEPRPPAAQAVRAPGNRYRAEATPREVIYRRPLSARVGAVLVFCLMSAMALAALWLAALSAGVLPSPHIHENPWLALLMLAGALMLGSSVLPILGMACPQELRVAPQGRTYTFRTGARPASPMLCALMASGVREEALREEIGLPWRTERFMGSCEDIAGVEIQEMAVKGSTSFVVRLQWHAPDRPRMRLGYARREEEALALQAQAAEELGVAAVGYSRPA